MLDNALAVGGRLLDLRTPTTVYPDVFLPLHGRHQADNAVVALTAVETFFAAPLADDVVREGFADVEMPGRFEVLGHQPLVIVDGAHNPAGCRRSPQVFFDDFDPTGRGSSSSARCAIRRRCSPRCAPTSSTSCSPAPRRRRGECRRPMSPRAAKALGCDEVIKSETVERACALAMRRRRRRRDLRHRLLYVVGAARPALRRSPQ